MTRRISKQLREQAALICEIAANGGVALEWPGDPPFLSHAYPEIRAALGASSDALSLAFEAQHAMNMELDLENTGEDIDIEAAALLRLGWNPGDPVPLRRS